MSYQSPTWPPPEGVTTPTVALKNTVFAVNATTKISAPASFIFNILLDTSTYPDWCTFVPKVTVDSQPSSNDDRTPSTTSKGPILKPSTKFTFYAKMGTGSSMQFPIHLILTDISTPDHPSDYIPATTLALEPTYTADLVSVYRIAWAADKSGFLTMRPNSERFHEVIVQGEEQCEVRTWECMGGILAHAVKWMFGQTLETKFEDWCRDLKEYGEQRWKEVKGKWKADSEDMATASRIVTLR